MTGVILFSRGLQNSDSTFTERTEHSCGKSFEVSQCNLILKDSERGGTGAYDPRQRSSFARCLTFHCLWTKHPQIFESWT